MGSREGRAGGSKGYRELETAAPEVGGSRAAGLSSANGSGEGRGVRGAGAGLGSEPGPSS